MKPYVLAAIFARGGSKGIPQKNIVDVCGKPLIAYAIEVGLSLRGVNKLVVSTDDPSIAKISRSLGAQIPFIRPPELALDDSPEILAWQHLIKEIENEEMREVDVLLSIPPTSPLRIAQDVQLCLDKLLATDADLVITVRQAERNPYFNMVTIDHQGDVKIVLNSPQAVTHRQSAPFVYDITTVAYAARGAFVKRAKSLFEGKVKAVEVPKERALDIDDEYDLEVARHFIQKRKEACA